MKTSRFMRSSSAPQARPGRPSKSQCTPCSRNWSLSPFRLRMPFIRRSLSPHLVDHRAKPDAHLQTVEFARLLDTDRVDILQVVVMMVMAVVMMVVMYHDRDRRGLRALQKSICAEVEDAAERSMSEFFARSILAIFVEPADLLLGFIELFRRREIGLVEHDQIGEGDLLAGLGQLFEPHRICTWRRPPSRRRPA